METITSTDGTRISYKSSGEGPPLILVHGTTADHHRWDSVRLRFAKHFNVYTLDRRGRGASGDAPVYALQREAEDVAAVVEAVCAQSGERAFLLGHSHGAVCSLEAALLTSQIERLILYEPPLPLGLPMYPPGFPERMQALVDQGELESALETFFREMVKMPEHELVKYRQLPMWQSRIQLAPTIPRELTIDRTYRFEPQAFANLQTPTLLLLGGDSPPLFQQAIAALEVALPNSTLVVLPGQQHIAMDSNPDLFVGEVLHFLLEQ